MKIGHLLLMACVLLTFSLSAQGEIKPNSEGYFHIQIREDLYVISNMSWGGLAENGTPTQNSQLIIGKEKALLIDTGMPKEGFADYVKSITSLPVMVVNSHGHFDHTGNNNQFDEIHIHPADDAIASGSPDLFKAWRAAGNSAELHMYSKGGHGFGMTKKGLPVDTWIERLGDWLNSQ